MTHTFDLGGWRSQLPADLPPVLRSWLCEQTSLTQRVQASCSVDAPFNLRVLRHDFALPHRDEAALLATPGRVRTREVLLCAGNTPLIFAHSVVARADLRGAWASMEGVGGRSLGSVLFADAAVSRNALYFKCCAQHHPLHVKAKHGCPERPLELWARRAVFLREQRPLVVTEVFLPSIMALTS